MRAIVLPMDLMICLLIRHTHPRVSRDYHRPPLPWAAVAHCESTGRWHINTGNGYYGGLQISLSTWIAYGGRQYAAYPHQASKWHQMIVAGRILRGQGKQAWPVCGTELP